MLASKSETLLGMKPLLIDVENRTFCSIHEPHAVWPPLQIVSAPCEKHKDTIGDNCSCGLLSTYSVFSVINWTSSNVELFKKLAENVDYLIDEYFMNEFRMLWDTDLYFAYQNKVQTTLKQIPVMSIIQVLGSTIVDEEMKTFRSWGGFLWGYIIPPFVNRDFFTILMNDTFRISFYRPVVYGDIPTAFIAVKDSLNYYADEFQVDKYVDVNVYLEEEDNYAKN